MSSIEETRNVVSSVGTGLEANITTFEELKGDYATMHDLLDKGLEIVGRIASITKEIETGVERNYSHIKDAKASFERALDLQAQAGLDQDSPAMEALIAARDKVASYDSTHRAILNALLSTSVWHEDFKNLLGMAKPFVSSAAEELSQAKISQEESATAMKRHSQENL